MNRSHPTSHFSRPLGTPDAFSPFATKLERTRAEIKSKQSRERGAMTAAIKSLVAGDEHRVLLKQHGGKHTRSTVDSLVSHGKTRRGWDKRMRTRIDGQHIVVYIPKEQEPS